MDAQVEGRPRKRSRTPERSASEPKNEGDHVCAVCHHPLAPGTPPHIHLPPIRSQRDAWSAAALDGAAIMQLDSPASPVFAPGSVGDHMQRMEPIRSLSPPRPSHRRPSYSDPFLAQVSETLHRAPQGYPTPPISPTPSEWFRNRPVGDLPRALHFPRDANPFLAQVTETLHRDRRRSPDTYPSPLARNTPGEWVSHRPSHPRASDPFRVQVAETLHQSRTGSPATYPTPPLSPTPSEWSRNSEVAELSERGAHPLLGVPPAVYPPRHPEQVHLPQYEELYFEVAGEDEGDWPRRTDALRP